MIELADSANPTKLIEENKIELQIDQETETLKRKRDESETVEQAKENREKTGDTNQTVTTGEESGQNEPVKKKKKQFVGKTNFVNNEFEDILESGWFYIDSYNKPQGPFSTKEMKQWYIAGFFFETTMVKRINEDQYAPISSCEEFKNCDTSSSIVSTDLYSMGEQKKEDFYAEQPIQSYNYYDQYGYYDQASSYTTQTTSTYSQTTPASSTSSSSSGNYAQAAYFNSQTGRFAPVRNHYAAKGLPEDREGRMLSHYLDIDSYQEAMNAAKNSGVENKVKVTKKMVEAFKKKKVEKQRKRILMM